MNKSAVLACVIVQHVTTGVGVLIVNKSAVLACVIVQHVATGVGVLIRTPRYFNYTQ